MLMNVNNFRNLTGDRCYQKYGGISFARIELRGEELAAKCMRSLPVVVGRESKRVPVEEICFFRAGYKYVTMAAQDRDYLISCPLVHLIERLDASQFCRIHRSIILNMDAMDSVAHAPGRKLFAKLKYRPELLPISQSYSVRFKQMSLL
ncbi:MAG: LytTR family transcriptional regulator [Burkholderiaceae bacterium]|nr:LytTR family transcriptional regulator [Roseateles sp.]MBV8471452.1 LytTR family transcriptional regulator [Burkholderiaceae bacterium]